MRRLVRATLLLALGVACREAPAPEAEPAPLLPRAAVVIEPPELALGATGVVEIALVTPPDYRVSPLPAPDELAGLWILDWQMQPVVREPERWLHGVRVRVRGREVGSFEWPALEIQLEDPEGARHVLRTEARPFQVSSALALRPGRSEPYPLRGPPEARGLGALLGAGAIGAAIALAGVGAVAWTRRARRRRALAAATAPPGPDRGAPWVELRARLEQARAEADADAVGAAASAARALRGYLRERFGIGVRARTTEELEAMRAPLALATRWRSVLALLRTLDDVRFRPDPPAGERAASAERVHEAIERARRFADETVPPEERP